ncbi:LacI family DNA-binding transcriptional regulator [Demequina mangrovi]|uniref:Transcriptional regulator, LacI family n=1 Tax=Demequina mangrovi TaxID=1043493 RepID=A0A1H7A8A5_9MICO|nr:LacI family DNA-binding transcriptional regulator [Demequina mangrovi]SEJ61821.1 transcriptional regulator, LacI family [Demequina mangrovi]
MATIVDVAEAAGVSISTVSYAMSGKRSIKADTRDRVLATAEALGYRPHASAQMLAAQRSHIVAVSEPVHPDTDDATHRAFAMEATKTARTRGYDTLLLVDDDALDGMQRSASTQLADGIVILDVDEDDARARLARELDCPSVFVGIPADTEGLMCVDLDFEEAARRAVDRLAASGHREIGLISHRMAPLDRGSNFIHRFLRAFVAQCARRRVRHAVVHPKGHDALESVNHLLHSLPDLDAVVLNTGADVASSLSTALRAHRLTVPREVSVIAAGVTFSTEDFPVPFDTMPLDAHASCTAAVDMLIDAIDGGNREPRVVLLPPTYVDRGSVRPRHPGYPPLRRVS